MSLSSPPRNSRELRPFTITSGADIDQSLVSPEKKHDPSMPKLWNGVYNAQCSALSPPDLMEAQPKLLPKTRSNSSSSGSNRNSKVIGEASTDFSRFFLAYLSLFLSLPSLLQYWIFSMIIERSTGPKRVEIAGDDAETPLEAILPAEQQLAEQVCLLRDSPYRILRVSSAANSLMYSSGPRRRPPGWGKRLARGLASSLVYASSQLQSAAASKIPASSAYISVVKPVSYHATQQVCSA